MWKNKSIPAPKGFKFAMTVESHGWKDLAPFLYDAESQTLRYSFQERNQRPLMASITSGGNSITIELDRAVSDKSDIPKRVMHILRFDDDLSEFYDGFCGENDLNWVQVKGAGRLLRSPTVFEDLVKTMCTTNCSWTLTKNMVSNLVDHLGGGTTFPSPEAMASQNEEFYREKIKAGYRSPFFVELAESVASNTLDPESWLSSELPTPELKNQIKSVKGIGDYAAENMLKLLGRYDGLALDSWLRGQFYKKHNSGKPCNDKKIEKRYSKFGKWKGLAIWCDMTEQWHN